MEAFSALLAFCAGNSPVTGELPTERPVTQCFDVFVDLHLNKRLSYQWRGWLFEMLSHPLWRHRNECTAVEITPVNMVIFAKLRSFCRTNEDATTFNRFLDLFYFYTAVIMLQNYPNRHFTTLGVHNKSIFLLFHFRAWKIIIQWPTYYDDLNERAASVLCPIHLHLLSHINSLPLGDVSEIYICNFQMDFSDWWLGHLLRNDPCINATGINWWSVNIASGSVLVPSGNKPLTYWPIQTESRRLYVKSSTFTRQQRDLMESARLMLALCQKRHYDDVIKWNHFPRYWPFVQGIHWSPVNSLHKGQWRGALMIYLIRGWINGWVNNREAGDMRRHLVHYDVTVMLWTQWQPMCIWIWPRQITETVIESKCPTTDNEAAPC